MKRDYKIINVGSHVNPPPTIWKEYFPKEIRDKAPVPAKVKYEDGEYEVLQLEGVNYRQLNSQIGIVTSQEEKLAKGVPFAKSFYGGDDGQRYPEARIKAMDMDNTDADVLIHGGWPHLAPKDKETQFGLSYAFNSWMGDFCKLDPARLIGIGETALWDIDLAVKELHRIAKLGLKGVLVPMVPGYVGNWSTPAEGPYSDPKYDPFWAALNDTGLVLAVHADAAAATPALQRYDNPGINMVINKTIPSEMIASLILSNVFTRYPNLKLVCMETGVGWMAHLITWMDLLYVKQSFMFKQLKEKPGDIFRRHVYGSFLWDNIGVANRDIIGIDNIMWCNDYPHDYGPWPHSSKQINEDLSGLTPEERHKILAGNAVKVFKL